jgi:hypothetical protein
MPSRSSKKDSPAKLASRMKRRWRVSCFAKRAKFSVRSRRPIWHQRRRPAVAQFDLDEIQRTRITVQELG